MMKLQENPKFKEDYKRYQKEILAITDDALKAELTKLFVEFTRLVADIDHHHSQLFLSNKLPADISDTRSKLSACIKKLDTKLQTWRKRNVS